MADTTFGKYRLIAELGHGGMADVFLAVQAGPVGSGFSKLTVVKRLRANLAEEPEFVSMLVDEARIAARLNHPNVVQTNEVGEVDDRYFIAMEYLDGQPFHRIQHRAAKVDPNCEKVTREIQYLILGDVLAGLHHAHELTDYDGTQLAIVHRDVTPHNIFVTYEGGVKVVDFGIAKAQGRASETRQGVVKGKVRYMAPEQAMGREIDRRADIFAAGVILWEIATGRRMWKDMDDFRIVQALINGEIPCSPRAVVPTVPEAIDAICQKALGKLEDRFNTAEEMREAIEQYLADAGSLVQARRKLPQVISELFKDKRAEIRGIIEKQLALLDARPSTEVRNLPLPPIPESVPSVAAVPVPVPLPLDDVASTVVSNQRPAVHQPAPAVSVDPAAPPPRKSFAPLIAAGIVAGLLATAAVVVWQKKSSNEITQPQIPTSAAVQVQTAGEVALRITGTPANAQVRVDGAPSRSLPLEVHVPKDDHEHRLDFEAEGYLGRSETVTFGHDVMLVVTLEKSTPANHDKDKGKSTPVAAAWTPPKTNHGAATAQKTAEPPPPDTPPAPSTDKKKLGIDKTDPWANKQ